MDRQIKFRFWDTLYYQMHRAVFNLDFCNSVLDTGGTNNYPEPIYQIPFAQGILLQYIGIKDRKGVEIYEGDVVISDLSNCQVVFCEKLGWDGGGSTHPGFYVKSQWIKDYDGEIELEYHTDLDDDCIVIGNIYENPELIEE